MAQEAVLGSACISPFATCSKLQKAPKKTDNYYFSKYYEQP